MGGGLAAFVHRSPAVADLGLVDRRLGRLELLTLVHDGAGLVEALAQLVGARVRWRRERSRLAPHRADDGRSGDADRTQPGRPGSHRADATLAAFLPRHRAVRSRAALAGEAALDRRKGGFGSMTDYEILLMLDPELPEERQTEIVTRVREAIERDGGRWDNEEPWGRRRLAYEIDHKPEGVYH